MRFQVTYSLLPVAVFVGGLGAQTVLPTGQMLLKPEFHPAVIRLQDGRVLLVGGRDDHSAQIYDPSSGEWRLSGSTVASTPYASAVLLQDGRVFVTGAQQPEIFSPETETFRQIESTPAANDQATLLADGRVLLKNWGGVVSLFDPSTETTVDAGSIEDGTPIALPDGHLAMIGASSALLSKIEEAALQPLGRHDFGGSLVARAAALLPDGTILIAGGAVSPIGASSATGNAWIYNPRDGTVEPTGSLPVAQSLFDADVLSNGTVLTAGGYFTHPGTDDEWASPALYDPSTGHFTEVSALLAGYKATSLLDGRVLITHRGRYSGGYWGTGPTAALYISKPRVLSAASLRGRVAPGSLATLYGVQLIGEAMIADLTGDLPTNLGGLTLSVIDAQGVERPAGLLYASPGQVNFVVPEGTAVGKATVVVRTPAGEATSQVAVDPSAPALFSFADQSAAAYGLREESDGTLFVMQHQAPIALNGQPTYLVLYGTGIRHCTSLDNVHCTIGGADVPVAYAGPDGAGIPGLDQVNVLLPQDLQGSGVVYLSLTVDGVKSNTVTIHLQ